MFKTFSSNVHARYEAMAKTELYQTDVIDIFESYLSFFPEGTNPIFRTRAEYDCNCCKNFVRRLGGLVSLEGGAVHTVWDDYDALPQPFRIVARKMSELVRQAPILQVFRTKERQYGNESNADSVLPKIWNHFHGRVKDKHFSLTPDTARGEIETRTSVFRRGLDELKLDCLATIEELIEAGSLYRGAEYLASVKEFGKLKFVYNGAEDKALFARLNASSPHALFRNTVMGTLAQDLSEGVELEVAVAKYEAKVAPQNYKRTTALITPKMIEQAVTKLRELGLEGAVHRRYATLADVSVTDVLFVDNAVQGKMRDGLTDLLMTAAKPSTVSVKEATTISADDFVRDVVPTVRGLSVLVQNKHLGNFVSLTGGDGPERLFKWDNNFAWSYDGDVADSMRQRVSAAGGRVDGVLRFTHTWNSVGRNASLMDLHVFMPGSSPHRDGKHDSYPSGQRVGWNKRTDPVSGGKQDVDYTGAAPEGYVPIENITFPDLKRLKQGTYTFKIHNWSLRAPTTSGFKAEIEFGGQIFTYDYPKPLGLKEWITVATAELKNGQFTITHALPSGTSSQQKWGVATETLVPVTTLLNSPNHWHGEASGNKHLIFALDKCVNPDETRGIYNEFLRAELTPHRKVFEVLGSKTKCPPSAEQISGLGFSAGRGDEVTVLAVTDKASRFYSIKF